MIGMQYLTKKYQKFLASKFQPSQYAILLFSVCVDVSQSGWETNTTTTDSSTATAILYSAVVAVR